MQIRTAHPDDAPAIRAIYAPIVEHTAISFEVDAPDEAEMRRRIQATLPRLPWLVGEDERAAVNGYVYASPFRERAAYQWAVEVTAYVREDCRGRGVARALYRRLFELLRELGYVQAVAGITLPNAASVGLHEALGFVRVAQFPNVGFKHGAWRDVGYWQKGLQGLQGPEGSTMAQAGREVDVPHAAADEGPAPEPQPPRPYQGGDATATAGPRRPA